MKDLRYLPKYHKYMISRNGDVYSFCRGNTLRKLRTFKTKGGYTVVNIHDKSIPKNDGKDIISVARLVLETWGSPRPSNKYKVFFKDRNRENLNIKNLEWKTQSEICRLNINKIKGNITRRRKRKMIIVIDGLKEAAKILGHVVFNHVNTGKETRFGFKIFDEKGYELWKTGMTEALNKSSIYQKNGEH